MRVAVIGAGISGLAAAHVLARTHDVTVFEAGAKPGGHTNTVRVDTEHETHWVDTGFIVFNDRNYPNFERLLSGLGVAGQPSNMSFSVTDQTGDFEYASTSANGLFAKRAHLATPWFLKMVADVRRFQNEARGLLQTTGDGPSLGDWLQERRYSRPFINNLFAPRPPAVGAAAPKQLGPSRARFRADFFHNQGLLTFPDP